MTCPRVAGPRYPSHMSFLDRALRMGEAKKFKTYEQRVAGSAASRRSSSTTPTRSCASPPTSCASAPATARPLDDLLYECFALVREAGKRSMGMRHFDVQLIGGMVLHDGAIAEMKTGEGKTLTATLWRWCSTRSAGAACTSSPSTTTWPAATRCG